MRDRGYELEKLPDVIDGEFTVEEISGYSCRTCRKRLLVRSERCPRCGRPFALPTPNRKNVPPGYSPARASVMAAVCRDRVTDEEVEIGYGLRGLPRPSDD